MHSVLFFLRSTEQYIANDIFRHAACLDDTSGITDAMRIYVEDIGKREGDIGVYAMVEHEVAGAGWVRLLKATPGRLDDNTPELIVGVKPAFRNRGVGTAILEQLFHEAAALYPRVSLSVRVGSPAISLFERFGFAKTDDSQKAGFFDDTPVVAMSMDLVRKAPPKPVKTYDPTYWMD